MKIVENNILPFKGYKAMTILKWIFVRKGVKLDERTINHETIHFKQEIELGFIFFYIWYIIEYLIKLLCTFDQKRAYRSISFEQEAYERQDNINWPTCRPRYYWTKFITKII